jgi:hypothetical protein
MRAIALNAKISIAKEPNPPAQPFDIKGDDLAYMRALECLTAAIYYEAANEPADGQRAVAQVVLNRVRHPAFPKSVCEVAFEGSRRRTGCQFSYTCNGALRRKPVQASWKGARAIAAAALDGAVFAPVGNATHYHANYVVPYWATELAKNAVVGKHIFYRWQGWWGQSAAFGQRHSGKEGDPRLLRHLALKSRDLFAAEVLPVGTDPRVELLSIVHSLAVEQPQEEDLSQYQREVREHFSVFSNHVAVAIYRQLLAANPKFNPEGALSSLMQYSDPPDLQLRGRLDRDFIEAAGGDDSYEGFIDALRHFAAHTNFEEFYQERRTYYTKLQVEAHERTTRLLATVDRNTGGRNREVRLLLAPLLEGLTGSGCHSGTVQTKTTPWIVVPTRGGSKTMFDNHAGLAKSIVGYFADGSKACTRQKG